MSVMRDVCKFLVDNEECSEMRLLAVLRKKHLIQGQRDGPDGSVFRAHDIAHPDNEKIIQESRADCVTYGQCYQSQTPTQTAPRYNRREFLSDVWSHDGPGEELNFKDPVAVAIMLQP